ncbi:conserved oligomeric Golgi complex subunit 5 [Achlya hypogyna]|uniref:Conserved oligomeric Golgi complex subunit 5 n=1 Tax=Achlya hypogyna TaxID=1202772 RepID=A0A1V9ZKW1_ACHHY|nr:conserved oligomeric Golgi complex subunit 5 [Achlya hypogyna]
MEDVVAKLGADEQLKVFLSPEVPVTDIASAIIAQDAKATKEASASSGSEEFLQKLSVAIQQIDTSIEAYVGASHVELLHQVGSVDGLKQHVKQLHTGVSDVKHALDRMDTDVQKVHRVLSRTMQQLRNVDTCTSIVQRVLRFQTLAQVLRDLSPLVLSSAHNDPEYYDACAKASLALHEAETLVQTSEDVARFQSLAIVAPEVPTQLKLRVHLIKTMKTTLKAGMTSTDQSKIASTLQVLYQLGLETFSENVQACVNEVLHDFETKCTAMLKESHLSTTPEDSGKVDAWIAAQNVLETLSSYALQVWHLQRVLVKLSAAKGASYFDAVVEPDEPSLVCTFWDISCALLSELFAKAMEYRASVKSVLISHYPRLRAEGVRVVTSWASTTSRLLAADAGISHRAMVLPIDAMQTELVDAFGAILAKYAERSADRMLNPIAMMFPQSAGYHPSPPSRSDMLTLLKILAAEVEAAGSDLQCVLTVLGGVRRAVDAFCAHIGATAHASPAVLALPPSSARTVAQAHNMALLSLCHQLDDALAELPVAKSKVAASLGAALAPPVAAIRDPLERLQERLLSTYLDVLATRCEGIFAAMHDESFTTAVAADRFMVDFAAVFNVLLSEHLGRLGLDGAPAAGVCLDAFCDRLLSAFSRHVALVRPLNDDGKCRLTHDMAQLELLLGRVRPLHGLAFEEFKAMKHLLFVDTSRVFRDARLDKIRPSNVWHHVLSRAPPALLLPHKMKGWTPAAYVAWMETAAGLDAYSPPVPPAEMPLGRAGWKDRTLALAAEHAIWAEVTAALETYASRTAALGKEAPDTVHDLVYESGASLLAGYEVATKTFLFPPA